jgi:hypothetical protein
MPKTLDDIQTLLTRRGYACKRLVDVIVATTVTTKIYKNPAGENALEIVLTIDHPNHCVAVEVLRAFELRESAHKEAALACLMTAAGRTPLLRPTLKPEGTVGLRVDCICGRNGAREGDVLQAVALLESWVEIWFRQVSTAMTNGIFNASEVPRLNLLRIGRGSSGRSKGHGGPGDNDGGQPRLVPSRHASSTAGDIQVATEGNPTGPLDATAETPAAGNDGEQATDDRSPGMGTVIRAAAISEKPGAHPNRLRVLFDFRRTLDQENGGHADRN